MYASMAAVILDNIHVYLLSTDGCYPQYNWGVAGYHLHYSHVSHNKSVQRFVDLVKVSGSRMFWGGVCGAGEYSSKVITKPN